jgi:hypothetical protein
LVKDFGTFKICGEGKFPKPSFSRAKPQKANLSDAVKPGASAFPVSASSHSSAVAPIVYSEPRRVYPEL